MSVAVNGGRVPAVGAGSVAPRPRHLHVVPAVAASHGAPEVSTATATYRRRRALVAVLALFVVLMGALLAARATAAGVEQDAGVVTVQTGESLSEIAAREMPDVRVAEAVALIERANNLGSTHVDAGEKLTIPAS